MTSSESFADKQYTIPELTLLTGLSEHELWRMIRRLGLETTRTAAGIRTSWHTAEKIFLEIAFKRTAQ